MIKQNQKHYLITEALPVPYIVHVIPKLRHYYLWPGGPW